MEPDTLSTFNVLCFDRTRRSKNRSLKLFDYVGFDGSVSRVFDEGLTTSDIGVTR